MYRIQIAVEQTNGDGLNPVLFKAVERGINIGNFHGRGLPPCVVDPPSHGPAQRAGHQYWWVGLAMRPRIVALTPADFERITEPLGRQQTRASALAFKHGIGGDRRAMDERRAAIEQRAGVEPLCRGRTREGLDHTLAGVRRDRRYLIDMKLLHRPNQHQVGKRAADVDADAPRSACHGAQAAALCFDRDFSLNAAEI